MDQSRAHRTRRHTVTRSLAAAVVATPVHLVSLGLVVLGGWLVWSGTSAWLGVVVLLVAVMLVWRPLRAGEREDSVLDLAAMPHTTALLHQVATAVGARSPRRAVLVRSYTAEYRADVHGRTLAVGAPLWLALDGEERIALLARTLAPRGTARSRTDAYVGHALGTLERWHRTLTPDATPDPQSVYDPIILTSDPVVVAERAQFRFGLDVAWVLLWPLRLLVGGYRRLLESVAAPLRRELARRVDEATAHAAGAEAASALRRELAYGDVVTALAQQAANTGSDLQTAIVQRTARIASADAADAAARGGMSPAAVQVLPERWVHLEEEWEPAVAEQFEHLRRDYR